MFQVSRIQRGTWHGARHTVSLIHILFPTTLLLLSLFWANHFRDCNSNPQILQRGLCRWVNCVSERLNIPPNFAGSLESQYDSRRDYWTAHSPSFIFPATPRAARTETSILQEPVVCRYWAQCFTYGSGYLLGPCLRRMPLWCQKCQSPASPGLLASRKTLNQDLEVSREKMAAFLSHFYVYERGFIRAVDSHGYGAWEVPRQAIFNRKTLGSW
jgi:hypothetical protein